MLMTCHVPDPLSPTGYCMLDPAGCAQSFVFTARRSFAARTGMAAHADTQSSSSLSQRKPQLPPHLRQLSVAGPCSQQGRHCSLLCLSFTEQQQRQACACAEPVHVSVLRVVDSRGHYTVAQQQQEVRTACPGAQSR